MRFSTWLRTPTVLRGLGADAGSAANLIAEAFVQANVPVAPHVVAWGQYIDRPGSEQVGLYGAAAGVGSLRYIDLRADLRQQAIRYLLQRFDGRKTNSTDRYQFELTLKIAGFLRSFSPADLTESRISRACNELVETLNRSKLPDAGGGFHIRADNPALLPTCLILVALYELGIQSQVKNRHDVLAWVLGQVESNFKSAHPGELALALHTLRAYAPEHADLHIEGPARTAHRWLLRQLRVGPTPWHDYMVSYTTTTTNRSGARRENDEYIVMPSGLMILQYMVSHFKFELVRPEV